MQIRKIAKTGTLVTVTLLCLWAEAQELKIGSRATPTLDPHFLFLESNLAYNKHLYDTLVAQDRSGKEVPGLATEWKLLEPTRWRFNLRKGVTFHDGQTLTADDVIYSFGRVTKVPNNPAPYTYYVSSIASVEKIDDHTVDIVTSKPNPFLPGLTYGIAIVQKKVVEPRGTPDFATGAAAIGTGPYKYAEYRPGERLVLERNDKYWGEKPHWAKLTFRIIPNDAGRTAALLAGDVDVIDNVPLSDVAALQANKGVSVSRWPTRRVVYLAPNQGIGQHPAVTDNDGRPLPKNPYSDIRVRRAISLAINRAALAEKVMNGNAEPANQIVASGSVGYLADRKADPFDPKEAAKLLTDAGYPNGFRTTLTCSNDRYPADAQLCQAIGGMLARVGIRTSVETLPASVFFTKTGRESQLPLYMIAWSNESWDAARVIAPLAHTYDKARGFGVNNNARYSSSDADKLIEAAIEQMDDRKRINTVQMVLRKITDDYFTVPLLRSTAVFATRAGLEYPARADDKNIAMTVLPRSKP